MIARIHAAPLQGQIQAIPSKSEAHRTLICAALSDGETRIRMGDGSEDIEATIRCLEAFGAKISREGDTLCVNPIVHPPVSAEADCGESGSTLRFLLPVAAALGIDTRFRMHGRLPHRPIAPLDGLLIQGGCLLERPEADVLRICGHLKSGNYTLPGNVSSQYISGMLFALSLLEGNSTLNVEGILESAGYVGMTLETLKSFGKVPQATNDGFYLRGGNRFNSPGQLTIGGDWSNAAFWLCASIFPGCRIAVSGLDEGSAQGDRRIVEKIAALKSCSQGMYTLDAADIPDLVPALAACACVLGKPMRVVRAQRLRIKESDRLSAIAATLNTLGGRVMETDDGLIVEKTASLTGGKVASWGDHRIAMMAAIASCGCAGEVEISGAEAVNKSYPAFWQDFCSLGGRVELREEVKQ